MKASSTSSIAVAAPRPGAARRPSESPRRKLEAPDERLLKKRRREVIHDPTPLVEEKASAPPLDNSRRRRHRVVERDTAGSGVDSEFSPRRNAPSPQARAMLLDDPDYRQLSENNSKTVASRPRAEPDPPRDDVNWHLLLPARSRPRLVEHQQTTTRSNERAKMRSSQDSPSRYTSPSNRRRLSRSDRRSRTREVSANRSRSGVPSQSRAASSSLRDAHQKNDVGRRDSPPPGRDERRARGSDVKKGLKELRSSSKQRREGETGGGGERENMANNTATVSTKFEPNPPAPAEGPPGPLQVPKTIAQLRVLLLVGLISSKTSSSDPQVPRLVLPCPIHSLVVTRLIKDYYRNSYAVSKQSLLPLQSSLIASELRCLSVPIADAGAGPLDNLLSTEELSLGEVIVNTFDFTRCDTLIRAALRATHPSNSRSLWQKGLLYSGLTVSQDLELGAGVGVEAREGIVSALSEVDEGGGQQLQTTSQQPSSTYGTSVVQAPAPNAATKFSSFPNSQQQQQVIYRGPGSSSSMTPMLPPGMLPPRILPVQRMGGGGGIGRELSANNVNIEELLSAPTAKEQQVLDSGAELRDLLSVPTAKHSITTRQFQSQGGSRVQQICRHGTRHECLLASTLAYNQHKSHHRPGDPYPPVPRVCPMVHFRRILLPHTDLSLGDCSYLDTCRHMSTCRFVHYEVDLHTGSEEQRSELIERMGTADFGSISAHNIGTVTALQNEELPAQWITCDVRKFDFSIFKGMIKIVMADPPWDIHMDLPYGTMTDAEMKGLRLDLVQDEGCLFLWVTGRAMELGRECMKLWGYQQIEEIVWVKTNQLHRIIRTGRTGHWVNHSKEHCLVGIKGSPKLNRNLDTDTIVAEVRETSRKPDEIYRIIERLSPGPYKLELFGRPHNVRNNWITLGNQLESHRLHDMTLVNKYNIFVETSGISSSENFGPL